VGGYTVILCFVGDEYIPLGGGYAIACLASIEGAKVKWSLGEPVVVAKLDPFSVWHAILVEIAIVGETEDAQIFPRWITVIT
jgi:hypothetical protein